jgi:sorbose reductase
MSMSIEECANLRVVRPLPATPENVFEQLSMKHRLVCITGASDGIGFAVEEAMAEAGADLALWYNTDDAAVLKRAQLATKHGIKVETYQVEVSDADKVRQTIQRRVEDFGRLDVFVANAGMSITKSALETTVEEYRKQMSLNVDGTFFCAKYAGEVFKKQDRGNLMITSSVSAHIVNVPLEEPVSSTTKAAITHLGKCLAREWRDFARVNIVSPGLFQTKMITQSVFANEAIHMTALGRPGHVKEIKGLYLYLASDASSFQTGSDTIVDGGYTLP